MTVNINSLRGAAWSHDDPDQAEVILEASLEIERLRAVREAGALVRDLYASQTDYGMELHDAIGALAEALAALEGSK